MDIPAGASVIEFSSVAYAPPRDARNRRGRDAPDGQPVLRDLNLPLRIAVDKKQVARAMRLDKKRRAAGVDFVLLSDIGRSLTRTIPLTELQEAIDDLC